LAVGQKNGSTLAERYLSVGRVEGLESISSSAPVHFDHGSDQRIS